MPQMKKSHQKRRWSARNLEEETIPGKPPSDGNTDFGGQIAGNFCFFRIWVDQMSTIESHAERALLKCQNHACQAKHLVSKKPEQHHASSGSTFKEAP